MRQQSKFAEAFHIPASALHWYAAYHDADTHPHIHMMIWTDQKTVLKRDAVVKLRSVMTNSIFQAELENLYIRKDAAYKDVTGAARETMRRIVDQLETVENPPESIRQKLMELALELRTVSGKKQYGYLKKSLKDKVDEIVDELESCQRWRRIMPSGMVCATRWRATTRTGPVSTIRSPSKKNSEPSRTRSFRKQSAYGSKWNRNFRKRKNRLRKKLLLALLQIRRLQARVLRPQLLILCGFRPNIF